MADGTAVRLVSLCSSLEEFVRVFRTFVHHDHVFVPTTDALAPGRKARMAITLADGTEVVAGDAEVLSSSSVPQGPHQKPGVRLRFATLDPAARDAIAKMERSRTEPVVVDGSGIGTDRANLVAAASGPGQDPSAAAMCKVVELAAPGAELRPKPGFGKPAGRTMLGAPIAPLPGLPAPGSVPGKSFKIPSIPSMPGRGTHVGPPPTAPGSGGIPAMPASSPASGDLTIPVESAEPSSPVIAAPAPAPASISGATPGGKQRNKGHVPTVRGRAGDPPAAPLDAGTGASSDAVVEAADPQLSAGWSAEAETAPMSEAATAATAAPEMPTRDVETMRMVPLVKPATEPPAMPVATAAPEPEPAPAPVATPEPAPVIASPAAMAAAAAIAPPQGRTFARTLLGVPALPGHAPKSDDAWAVPEDGLIGEPTERSVGPMFGVELEVTARSESPPAPPLAAPSWPLATPAATPPPTPSAPWQPIASAPGPFRLPSTPPGASVAALQPAVSDKAAPPPPPLAPAFTPPVAAVAEDAVPRHREVEPTELVYDRAPKDDTDIITLKRRQRRPLIIAAVALGVVAIAVIAVMASGGGGGGGAKGSGTGVALAAGSRTGSVDAAAAPQVIAAIDAAVEEQAVAPDAAAAAEDPPDEPPPVVDATVKDPPPAADTCAVAFSSTPKGADVVIARKKRGRTPITLDLPCKKTKVEITRSHYDDESKTVTPKPGSTTKVSVRLERPKFTIKVTSAPTGATVTVGGKASGKTPATVKVEGYEDVSIKVSKPGFQTKATSVNAKKDGALKVTLKRGN